MQDQKFSMIISHQIALVPNNKQASRLNQAVGVSRFAYNWALAEWKDQYQLCTKDSSLKKPTSNALDKKLNSIKLEKFPWMYSVPSCVAQRAVSDAGFFEFRRHLEYKMRIRGGEVLTADRWFASSKLCSTCGTKNKELSLKQRKWTCLCCGSVHDRDVNAAINLKNLAVKYTVTASGEEGSGRGSSATLKPASKKQELDSAQAHRN